MTETQEDVIAVAVEVGSGRLWVELDDGRVIGTPLNWYMPLINATPEQLGNYELLDDSIYWPELDEDLSVAGMLAGVRPHYPWTVEQWQTRTASVRSLTEHYDSDATVLLPINMTDPLDASVTVREIAQDYGLSTDAVYQAIRRERLPAHRSGATWLIRRRDAEDLWGTKKETKTKVKHDAITQTNMQTIAELEITERQRQYFLQGFIEASRFSISRAAIRGEKFHIAVSKKQGFELEAQTKLVIVDMNDWMQKGVFEVKEETPTEYDAVATRDVDPVWKGFVNQQGDTSVPSNMAAFAFAGGQI